MESQQEFVLQSIEEQDIRFIRLWFTDILWPDFTAGVLQQALDDYARRERRFGLIERHARVGRIELHERLAGRNRDPRLEQDLDHAAGHLGRDVDLTDRGHGADATQELRQRPRDGGDRDHEDWWIFFCSF